MFTTIWQFGCDALITLGQTEETGRGARPLTRPQLPDILPRWDDICITALSLAHQCGLLSYRQPDGHEFPEAAEWWSRREGEVMPPQALDALIVDLPSGIPQQSCNPAIAIAAILPGQFDHIRNQTVFVHPAFRQSALC